MVHRWMRILLATTFLNSLTGSELFLYDLAGGLRRRGHRVTCWVKEPAPTAPLPRLLGLNGVHVSPELPHEAEIEAVIFQLKETFPVFRERYMDVPRLAVCHGPRLPAEIAPPELPCTTQIALTREGYEYLRRAGYEDVAFTGYGVDLTRFSSALPLPERPRRAVLHSKYADAELVREACARLGIEITVLGAESWRPGFSTDDHSAIVEVLDDGRVVDHEPSLAAFHVERILADADLVFGLGRSAVEALAMGKACFVFGYGKIGDGLVTQARLPALARVNFSGRAHAFAFDVDSIVAELQQFSARQGAVNRRFARERYDLEGFLDRIERLLLAVRSRRRRRLLSFTPWAVKAGLARGA
jgi:hypothetical protein